MSVNSFINRARNVGHKVDVWIGGKHQTVSDAAVPNLAAGLALINDASLDELQSSHFIEAELLPKLGLNDEMQHEQPQSLRDCLGKGLGWRIWQYPNQFSKYLVSLSKAKVSSYIEIGCRFGGTFVLTVEYLRRFNPDFRDAIAVDLIEQSRLLQEYGNHRRYRYLRCDSSGPNFARAIGNQKFDLAMIDGDHSFESVLSDFKIMRWRASRIVLHDINSTACPGVVRFWNFAKGLLQTEFEFSEFVDQYPDVPNGRFLGIGVMRRISEQAQTCCEEFGAGLQI